MKAVVDEFKVGQDNLQLAVVYYDNSGSVSMDFDGTLSKEDTKLMIDRISEGGQGSQYSEGLKKAEEILTKNKRDDVKVGLSVSCWLSSTCFRIQLQKL